MAFSLLYKYLLLIYDWFIDFQLMICNHVTSYFLYAETVRNDSPLTAYSCNNFEDFTSGKCGKNETVGYTIAEKPETPGHKVFLLTRDTKPTKGGDLAGITDRNLP